MTESNHILLSKSEFKTLLAAEGYDPQALGKLFGTLVRTSIRPGMPRQPDGIGFYETNRAGEEEVVLSVPNLAAQLDTIADVREIGERSVEICRHLVEISGIAVPDSSSAATH